MEEQIQQMSTKTPWLWSISKFPIYAIYWLEIWIRHENWRWWGEGKMGNASLIHEIFQTSFELVIVTKHYINIEQGISQDSQLSILLENRIVK